MSVSSFDNANTIFKEEEEELENKTFGTNSAFLRNFLCFGTVEWKCDTAEYRKGRGK